jgi:hypothetical protein
VGFVKNLPTMPGTAVFHRKGRKGFNRYIDGSREVLFIPFPVNKS